ncbi:hypothetical protein VPH35_098727 [Triticum aestivum]
MKMKIGKAPVLMKKAVAICKSKTGVIMARLRILTSPNCRMATIGAISHRIHTLILENQEKGAKVDYHKTLARKVERPTCHGMFDEEDGVGGCPNWTLHPIFSDGDNCCYTYGYDNGDDDEDSTWTTILTRLLKCSLEGSVSRSFHEVSFHMYLTRMLPLNR